MSLSARACSKGFTFCGHYACKVKRLRETVIPFLLQSVTLKLEDLDLCDDDSDSDDDDDEHLADDEHKGKIKKEEDPIEPDFESMERREIVRYFREGGV